MKKALFLIGYFAFIALFVSCGDQTSKSDSNSQTTTEKTLSNNSSVKSPVGTYSAVENGNPMQFILKDDATGYENYKGIENRPFTWKSKDGKIFFMYNGQSQEWELPIDIEKGEIIYGSLVYKRNELYLGFSCIQIALNNASDNKAKVWQSWVNKIVNLKINSGVQLQSVLHINL